MNLTLPRLSLPFIALVIALPSARAQVDPVAPGEWPSYGHDRGSTKYSPLNQIDAKNFGRLRVAWRWRVTDTTRPGPNECTPLMVGGTLYVITPEDRVAALDARTGKQKWEFNPKVGGGIHRGVAYWAAGVDRRILVPTFGSWLYALNADTGKPIPSFGKNGRVDLTLGLRKLVDRAVVNQTSPPVICGNVVVVGGAVDDFHNTKEMPPGDVRGFDVRTGKQLWTFHTVPQPGEAGNDTWRDESWRYTGNTNVWTMMSYDPALDYVYLPVSTPSNDWYGGHRKGAGLFGESLVCLKASTGKLVWAFQFVHHGLWDYDLPCAPNLLDVTVGGRKVKAVAQVTKQAMTYVFDRVTGKPIWPIVETPVLPSKVPGEEAWPTQPIPSKPKPFDRQGVTEDDVIDFTPELRKEAMDILAGYWYGPLYNPPNLGKKTLEMPGWLGGASWAGASVDPASGVLYVPSITNPMWLELAKPTTPGADVDFTNVANSMTVDGPRGLPLLKPPYGRITAIDLNTGEHLWQVPLGDGYRNHPALRNLKLPLLGLNRRGYIVVTKTLLLVTQEGSWFNEPGGTSVPLLRAFDKRSGKLIGQVGLPSHSTGSPITYMAGGKQFIVVPIGGASRPAEFVALSLP